MLSSKKLIVIAVVLILLVSAGVTLFLNSHWFISAASKTVRLELTGTDGLKISGDYNVDGVSTPFSGVLPAAINATAREFTYTIRLVDGNGNINGKLFVDGTAMGSSGTSGKSAGVKGGFERRGGLFPSQGAFFTTFNENTPAP